MEQSMEHFGGGCPACRKGESMKKVVYLINLYCDSDDERKEFEKWLTDVFYRINAKTINRNIIIEYDRLYEKSNISELD